jgi:NAD(P)-dependent dehydrogenase (short-subunit alcohol dehydrogenase family)
MSDAFRPMAELFSLRDRVAVVTGGAGPLGAVLSRTLADCGAQVVVVDKDAESCERALEMLRATSDARHAVVVADLLADGAADVVVSAVEESHGRLDVLVNNAAFTGTSGVPGYAVPFEEQTTRAFELATRLNLVVPFALTQRAHRLLASSGHGAVVNVSSIYGLVGPNMRLYDGTAMGNPAAYGATKGGVGQLTRYLATVLAPEVRVNAIAPGGIARGQEARFVERYSGLTPLGRMATEDDMRGAVAWLAGDAASYVTGQVVAVDGGWTAW